MFPEPPPLTSQASLAMAERHVKEGILHVCRQKEIIERLEEIGGDVDMARSLLDQFEAVLAEHIIHRDRIRASVEDR
jgi:hemerythrin